jgi:hypothetical protein
MTNEAHHSSPVGLTSSSDDIYKITGERAGVYQKQ